MIKNPKDTNHLRSVGGKVPLPRELSKIIHPETKTKDDGFNLLSAFQGLSFSTAALTGRNHSKTPVASVNADSCKVMWSICDHREDQYTTQIWLLLKHKLCFHMLHQRVCCHNEAVSLRLYFEHIVCLLCSNDNVKLPDILTSYKCCTRHTFNWAVNLYINVLFHQSVELQVTSHLVMCCF